MLKEGLVEESGSTEELVLVRPSGVDRRRGFSERERAGQVLAHAVDYLVSEQLQGRATLVSANRAAIAILCEAGRMLDAMERREPARQLIAGWLRKASLNRGGGKRG